MNGTEYCLFYSFAYQVKQNIQRFIMMIMFLLNIHRKSLYIVFIHFLPFLHVEKIVNNLRDINPQNGKKFKRTQAEFKI